MLSLFHGAEPSSRPIGPGNIVEVWDVDFILTPVTAKADVEMPNCKSPLRVDKHLLPIQMAEGAANTGQFF